LIRYNIGVKILKKIAIFNEETVLNGAYSRNAFNLSSNNKDVKFKSEKGKLKVYLAKGQTGFIDKNKIPEFKNLSSIVNKWKVIVAKASPGFDELPHSIISNPIVSEPGSLCTDTHLLVRIFKNNLQAENFNYYMKTKFFRFMMLLAKNNHNMSKDVFQFVPLQNLDKKWTDKQLYKKYKLSAEEINFIESVIKDRN
jgi:site-specific DNA-methyltransferase (adenine-specific)